ncbi:MAG: dihydrolipoyl dehydrogenase [Spirochaetales bacterium]|nr:dihydrolipoyl dehydrogenase [Spirochaetales bacterium]
MGKFMLMPKLDMSMEEGVIVSWMVNKGDKVGKGDLVVEVETGKVNLEVDNTAGKGVVLEFYAEPGDTIKVNEPIMYVGKEGEVPPPPPVSCGVSSKAPATPSVDSGSYDWDLAVIGGGPGGYVCAIRSAQLGAKVVLFEKEDIGGVCLNRGCIPTKTLVKNAELWKSIANVEEFGITVSKPSFDWLKIQKRKAGVVSKLVGGVASLLKKNKVEVVKAYAEVASAHSISANGKSFNVKNIVIAAGSVSAKVPVDVTDKTPVYSAEELLSIEALPENLLVVGGGVIGLEMASIFASFGVGTSIVELADDILPPADGEIRASLKKSLTDSGINFYCGRTVKTVGNRKALLSDGTEVGCDAVLVAVGRTLPADFKPGIEILRGERGWITVDEDLKTSVDSVYAIGDITGGIQLAHLASAQGVAVSEGLFGMKGKPINEDLVPSCIFTNPEAAWVGLTREEADRCGIPVKEGRFPFQASGKALAEGETGGFVKVLTDSRWDEVIGVHIVGANAVNLIAEAAAAMSFETTAEELAKIIHAHPTISEAIMEAAGDVAGMAVHI